MSREFPDRLPSHAPVLVSQLNLGHRRGELGGTACGARGKFVRASAIQCTAWSVAPCPTCWQGRQPW